MVGIQTLVISSSCIPQVCSAIKHSITLYEEKNFLHFYSYSILFLSIEKVAVFLNYSLRYLEGNVVFEKFLVLIIDPELSIV